ncbi:MAG: hypothetical protein PVG54_14310 [Anaerolineae bacterium]
MRSSQLDGVSATILTPYPGTEQREQLLQEGRILPHDTWQAYDTNHVTYVPAQMTAQQLAEAYDWLCKKLYNPLYMAARGVRAWRRHPWTQARKRFVSSFSTDIGYRRTNRYRHRQYGTAPLGTASRP